MKRSFKSEAHLSSICDFNLHLVLTKKIDLPKDLFAQISTQQLERFRRRVEAEAPFELRRHTDDFIGCFCTLRGRSLTGGLVDLLIEIIFHIGARAERKVELELLDNFKCVSVKNKLLFISADAALGKPDGILRDVIFPVVQTWLFL